MDTRIWFAESYVHPDLYGIWQLCPQIMNIMPRDPMVKKELLFGDILWVGMVLVEY